MLKVNEAKLLQDYQALVQKKKDNLATIEAGARAFATSRGYDEKTTEEFVKFTQKLEGNGLTGNDAIILEILSKYVEEVEIPQAVEPTVINQTASTMVDSAVVANI